MKKLREKITDIWTRFVFLFFCQDRFNEMKIAWHKRHLEIIGRMMTRDKHHLDIIGRMQGLQTQDKNQEKKLFRVEQSLQTVIAEFMKISAHWKLLDKQLQSNAVVINRNFVDINNHTKRMDGAHILLKRQIDAVRKMIADSAESIATSPAPAPALVPRRTMSGRHVRTPELRKKISDSVKAYNTEKKAAIQKLEKVNQNRKNASERMKAWHRINKQAMLNQTSVVEPAA